MVHDIEVGKSDLSQTQEDLAAVKEKLTSYYEERHRLETENQELKQKRHQISEQISSDQQTLVDVTRLISDFERQIDLYTMAVSYTHLDVYKRQLYHDALSDFG